MKYWINYGFGSAYLYTPYEDYERRFYTLGNTCFGLRKSIMYCDLIEKTDEEPEEKYPGENERLEFSGDCYIWNEDGARKMISPFLDEEWDNDYCGDCRFRQEDPPA